MNDRETPRVPAVTVEPDWKRCEEHPGSPMDMCRECFHDACAATETAEAERDEARARVDALGGALHEHATACPTGASLLEFLLRSETPWVVIVAERDEARAEVARLRERTGALERVIAAARDVTGRARRYGLISVSEILACDLDAALAALDAKEGTR